MLNCRICGCYCDPSDLQNGVCDDCREIERKRAENAKERERLIAAEFKQMEIEDMISSAY